MPWSCFVCMASSRARRFCRSHRGQDFQDIFDILDFVAENDLVDNVDPIQYTIRLLVPRGSLLLRDPGFRSLLGDFDEDRLTYAWQSANPRLDVLQRRLLEIAERAAQTDAPSLETFIEIGEAVVDAADYPTARGQSSKWRLSASNGTRPG